MGATSPNVASAADTPYGNRNVKEGDDYIPQSESPILFSKDSGQFIGSVSSSDLSVVSSLSFSSTSSSFSDEPLHDFSELLAQLPIKRGLSKFYKGKSRTFTSLSDVRCVEDLAKSEIPHRKRAQNSSHSPKATISKKAGRSCFTSLVSKWS